MFLYTLSSPEGLLQAVIARMKTPRIASVLLLAPTLAAAETPPRDGLPLESLPLAGFVEVTSLEQLGNLVVTDTKLEQSADTVTQRIVVLRSEEIEHIPSPNRNLAELLRHTSGQFVNVLSRNDANWGSYAGLGPKYNSYLLDGLPIDAFVDAMSLDSAAIERVEVHKGPASVLYSNYLSMDFVGNQTPLAGTTNFVLKNRIDTPLTRFSAGAGSWGSYRGSAYTQSNAGQLGYILSAGHERADYTPYGMPGSWLQTTQSPHYEKDKFFLKLNYALDRPDHTLSVFYQRTFHQGNMGRPNRDFEHHYDTLNFAYNNAFATDWHLQFKYGERRYDRNFANDDYPTSLALVNRENTRQTIRPADLTLSHRHGQGAALLTLGVDAQWVDYETDVRSPAGGVSAENRAQARSTGYFIQEKVQLDQWILRGGLRRNTLQHDYARLGGNTPATSAASWSKNLWSLGTRYKLSPGLAFYANAGSSFMAPVAKQIGGTIYQRGAAQPRPQTGERHRPRPGHGLAAEPGAGHRPARLSQHPRRRHRHQHHQRHPLSGPLRKRRQRPGPGLRAGCTLQPLDHAQPVRQPDPHPHPGQRPEQCRPQRHRDSLRAGRTGQCRRVPAPARRPPRSGLLPLGRALLRQHLPRRQAGLRPLRAGERPAVQGSGPQYPA